MNITEQIEANIKTLKKKRLADEKIKQYALISSGINTFFKQTGIKQFNRSLILSFFEKDFYPLSTESRHTKNILSTMKEKGIITDGEKVRIGKQRRTYELKSKDFESYFALMKDNGYSVVNYFKFYCDSDGIPRRRKVGTSRINGLPVDKNGEAVEDFDLCLLKQTIPRRKQGVYSYGNKSIAVEKRAYKVKCFKVI